MLMILLVLILFGTLLLIVVRRRQIGRLTSFATLIAALIVMIWMQDKGLLTDPRRPAAQASPTMPAR